MVTYRKQSRGHMGGVRLWAECDEAVIGFAPKQTEIPSPYRFSPSHEVFHHPRYGNVIVNEVAHRRYALYSYDGPVYPTDEEATAQFIAQRHVA